MAVSRTGYLLFMRSIRSERQMPRFQWRFFFCVNGVRSFGFRKRQDFFSAYYQARNEDTITMDLDMAWNTRDSVCKQLRLPVLKRM